MSYHLIEAVQGFGQPRILVLGDLILDRYVWGDAERISQEAPVILLREDRQEVRLGGAANVANMLRGLDAEVSMAGVLGNDADGQAAREAMLAANVDCEMVLGVDDRPTTVKTRFIGRAQHRHPHQMLRVDRESRKPLEHHDAYELIDRVVANINQYHAVLISDYAKGVCSPLILSRLIDEANKSGIPVIIDPAAGVDYSRYKKATAITPNRLETQLATGSTVSNPEQAFQAGTSLCARLELDHAFITLDSDGMAVVFADGRTELLPTRKRQVYDITGAGDMVLATIGLGAAEGLDPTDLARLANISGGLEVEQIGVANVSRQEILADLLQGPRALSDKFRTLPELSRHIAARRRLGQKIVMTNGCFDVLHTGHVTYLQEAAAEGDCLVVAINSDDSVRRLNKGPDRPVFSQDHRAEMLVALESVDYVVVFDESTPHAVIDSIQPDVLVKGGTYRPEEVVGRELVDAYGGTVKVLSAVDGISTTNILQRLRENGPQSSPAFSIANKERKAG